MRPWGGGAWAGKVETVLCRTHDSIVPLFGEVADARRVRVATVDLPQSFPSTLRTMELDDGCCGVVGETGTSTLRRRFRPLFHLLGRISLCLSEHLKVVGTGTACRVRASIGEVEIPPVQFLVDEVPGEAQSVKGVQVGFFLCCEMDVREREAGVEGGFGLIVGAVTLQEVVTEVVAASLG